MIQDHSRPVAGSVLAKDYWQVFSSRLSKWHLFIAFVNPNQASIVHLFSLPVFPFKKQHLNSEIKGRIRIYFEIWLV
jgi:hypothetical protein